MTIAFPPTASTGVYVTGPEQWETRTIPLPSIGPRDVLVRIRACGVCGTDVGYLREGGMGSGPLPIGHEAAGVVAAVGADVTGIAPDDHVVVNPMAAPDGTIGSGSRYGAIADWIVLHDAEANRALHRIDPAVPFAVAALNEPMAVAKHLTNQLGVKAGETAVVFGAGPIGLGTAIWLKLAGLAHVVVVDVVARRLQTALAVGADAVVDATTDDVGARLAQLHGPGTNVVGAPRAGTDVYVDAAGHESVITAFLDNGKQGARLGIVGMHHAPVNVDLRRFLAGELRMVASVGYPTEIFQVTDDLARHWRRFAPLVSDEIDVADVDRALRLTLTPGGADKVVITFPEHV